MAMEFLRFLEGLRTPIGDAFFLAVTHLGEEIIFIVIGILFFWCVDKKKGYYILSVGFMGTVFNQFLKLWFRVPRPWVKDPAFFIVESARAGATGYSFPSGHTQAAVGMYGSIARACKSIWLRVISILLCVLVPLSRMYLGVHTPADVAASVGVALILIFGLYPIMNKAVENPKYMRICFAVMAAFTLLFLIFVLCYSFPANIDMHNYESGVKNGYKMLGCILGLWSGYELDAHYIHFETKAVWWVQILKLVPGFLLLLAVKSGLKTPLNTLLNGNFLADGIRYFLLTVVASGIWLMTFRFWNKLGHKKTYT